MLKSGKFGILNLEIPAWILSSRKNQIEWLRAFFDCEAYVDKRAIVLKTVNLHGLSQIKVLLNNLEISSRLYQYQPKNKNHKLNHILIIGRKEDRERYKKVIGFNHTTKLKKLDNF